jgi:3-hydroxyacyl-CoA dehydrogenase
MRMNQRIRIERDGDVAVIVIDNPPINAGSAQVRAGLLRAVQAVDADDDIKAAVLIGAGKTFIAGSDIREFGQPLADPQLPAVIEAIEHCPKPFVAALHGAALGGGYELALGCDARIAARQTVVGLPEVTLGIIPGAGGTQRLPRLTGVPRAISLICAGERVPADKALAAGLIDAIADGDLRGAAVELARAAAKRRVRDLPVPQAADEDVEQAAQQALKAGRHRPQVGAAIDAIRASRAINSLPNATASSCPSWNTQARGPSFRWPSSAPAPWAPASPSPLSMPATGCCCSNRKTPRCGAGWTASMGITRRACGHRSCRRTRRASGPPP